jgi:hypothetical protein
MFNKRLKMQQKKPDKYVTVEIWNSYVVKALLILFLVWYRQKASPLRLHCECLILNLYCDNICYWAY